MVPRSLQQMKPCLGYIRGEVLSLGNRDDLVVCGVGYERRRTNSLQVRPHVGQRKLLQEVGSAVRAHEFPVGIEGGVQISPWDRNQLREERAKKFLPIVPDIFE